MSYFLGNPRDVGIAVIDGLTDNRDSSPQTEFNQKIKDLKESLRSKKPLIMDEFWDTQKSKSIDELHKEHPFIKVGNG